MAFNDMLMGGILWSILRGVEKYPCRRDADRAYVLLCHKIDKAR